jgi:hypothetical protein
MKFGRTGHWTKMRRDIARSSELDSSGHSRSRVVFIIITSGRSFRYRPLRRVVAQGDSLQRAEEITCGKRAGCGRDRRVHSNPATLVALIASYPVLNGFIIRNHRWPL